MKMVISAVGLGMEKYIEKLNSAGFAVTELNDDKVDMRNPYRKMMVEAGESIRDLARLGEVVGNDIILRSGGEIVIYDDYME